MLQSYALNLHAALVWLPNFQLQHVRGIDEDGLISRYYLMMCRLRISEMLLRSGNGFLILEKSPQHRLRLLL